MASPAGWRSLPTRPRAVFATFPFTIGAFAVIVLVGLIFGTWWHALRDRRLLHSVAYGVPALEHGKWWTPVTGSLYALQPSGYIAALVVFVVLVGFAEWRLGTRTTAIVTVATQLVVVILTSALLIPLRATGWNWAVALAHRELAGFLPGAFGAFATATVTLRAPWRSRMRVVLIGYVVLLALYRGAPRDVEQLLAVGLGLLLGPLIESRAPSFARPRMSRHEWRMAAAFVFAVSAAIRLVLIIAPNSAAPLRPEVVQGFDWTELIFGVLLPLALAEGLRRGRRLAWRIAMVIAVIECLALLGVVTVIAAVIITGSTDTRYDIDSLGASLADALLWLTQLGVLWLGRRAFRGTPWRDRRRAAVEHGAAQSDVQRILREVGGGRLSWMTTWEGNEWYVEPDRPGYVAYQTYAGVAVALCDPVAIDAAGRRAMGEAFIDYIQGRGLLPCLFSVTSEVSEWVQLDGWRTAEVAVEAVIDLPDLQYKGKAWQDVRSALNRATKEGVTFELGPLRDMPANRLAQVRTISEQWVGDKGLPEMGFTLGGVDEALDPAVRVGLAVDAQSTVHGVTSWLPIYGPDGTVQGWTLDVMRRLPDGFRPVMEFLIASSCVTFREEGALLVSLSGAPLAGDPTTNPNASAVDALLAWLGEQLEPLYGFRSLDRFKSKFFPRHEPLYLAYPDEASLPRIGIALTRAYLPDASFVDLAAAGLRSRTAAAH
jgi:lysylphosphatidylglycerol synthetase-like protein (DUF2156 family)